MRVIAFKTNFVDYPNAAHKSHLKATPYLGGVSIMIGILTVTYSSLVVIDDMRGYLWIATSLFGPALILGLVGLFDDRKGLSPLPRFIAQTSAAIFTAFIIISTNTVGNPTGNSAFDAILTIIWIVVITNSINFFDNLDGGAAGAIASTAIGLFLISLGNKQHLISATSITVLAAMVGFLIWNKSPAKIYMGDAGALFLGTVIGVLTIRLNPNLDSKVASFSIPVLLLAVPILDTSVAILSRIRRRISIFRGGQDHLSHRLIRRGFSKKQAAFTLWSLSAIFAAMATKLASNLPNPNYLIALAASFWLSLFLLFLRSSDT